MKYPIDKIVIGTATRDSSLAGFAHVITFKPLLSPENNLHHLVIVPDEMLQKYCDQENTALPEMLKAITPFTFRIPRSLCCDPNLKTDGLDPITFSRSEAMQQEISNFRVTWHLDLNSQSSATEEPDGIITLWPPDVPGGISGGSGGGGNEDDEDRDGGGEREPTMSGPGKKSGANTEEEDEPEADPKEEPPRDPVFPNNPEPKKKPKKDPENPSRT